MVPLLCTRLPHAPARIRLALFIAVFALPGVRAASAELVACRGMRDPHPIERALERIGRSLDPCGGSAEVAGLIEKLRRCPDATYEICVDLDASRNFFETGSPGRDGHRWATITWNPTLRSALEVGCDGDPSRNLTRDPTASLVHELAHAVQHCEGRNPGASELDAVRVENIYRRAAGLCQRTGYGESILPVTTLGTCRDGRCTCPGPGRADDLRRHPAGNRHDARAADAAPGETRLDPAR